MVDNPEGRTFGQTWLVRFGFSEQLELDEIFGTRPHESQLSKAQLPEWKGLTSTS